MPGNGGVVLCVQREVFHITQQTLNIELNQNQALFCLKKNIAGFSTLKANHFMTSLFKFRFCFAGGSLDLKQKPYSPGTVTSDYFQ